MEKKPKHLLIVAVVAAAAVIGSLTGLYLFRGGVDFDSQLMSAATDLNKQCPIMVDKETRLDNTIGGPGKLFVYNYTLVNYTVDQLKIPDLEAYLRPRLIQSASTNADMQSFRENAVTLVYRYSDKNNKFAFEIKVSPEEYAR